MSYLFYLNSVLIIIYLIPILTGFYIPTFICYFVPFFIANKCAVYNISLQRLFPSSSNSNKKINEAILEINHALTGW